MNSSDERRVVLLLTTVPGATPKQIRGELVGRTAPMLQRAADAGVELVTGIRIADDPLEAAAKATGRDITPVSAIVEITGAPGTPDDTLLKPLEGFGNWFGGVFDKTISVVALGTVRKITEGPSGPILLALGTKKLARLSQSEFHDYWAGTHAPLALSLMPKGAAERISYQQLHADAEASERAAEVVGVGRGDCTGVLQVRCAEPADFLDVATEPGFAKAIYEDELNFTDQSEMRGGFLEI